MCLSSFLVVSVLVLGAGVARAADFCVVPVPGSGSQFVGKDFRMPGKGKCKAWNGILITSFSDVSVTTGTGCTSSDGTTLRLHLVSAREALAFNDYIVLPLPALTGGTADEIVAQFGSSVTHFTGVTAGKCDPKSIPIP
jgi:hypothetical protein